MRLHAAQKSLRWWPILLTGVLLLMSLLAPVAGATHASAKRATQPSVAIKGAPFKGAVAKGVVNLSTLPKATANASPASQPSLPLPQRGMSPQRQVEYDKNAIHLPGMPSAVGHPAPSRSVATSPNFVGGGVVPPVYRSFEGLNSTQGTGNNTGGQSMAIDLSYVMQTTVNAVGIYSSASGALLYGPYTSSSFFAPVKLNGDFLVEPQAFYDVMRDRWIVVYSELTTSSVVDHGYIDIAVSQSNSPTQPTPGGQYWLYRLEATQFNTQYGERCSTPQVGADYWGLYITCLAQENGPGGLIDNYILALDKTRLYNGTSASGFVYKSIPIDLNTCGSGGNSPCPARILNPAVEDGVPDAEFFTAIDENYVAVSSNLTLCAMTNTNALTGNGAPPTLTCGNNTLPTAYAYPVSAQLPGGVTWNIGNAPSRVEYKAGMLHLSWTTAAVANNSTVDGIYWLDIEPYLTTVAAHNPPWINGLAIHNQGIWALSSQTYLLSPMLWTSDEQDDVLVYIVVSSAHTIYPSIGYSGRKATDAPDTLGQDTSAFVVTGTRASSAFAPMCALPLNSVTRGIVWCSAGYGGSQPNPGWTTRIFALRTE